MNSIGSCSSLCQRINLLGRTVGARGCTGTHITICRVPFMYFRGRMGSRNRAVCVFEKLCAFKPSGKSGCAFKFSASLFPSLLDVRKSSGSPLYALFHIP